MTNDDLLDAIRAALGTEERGDDLVEVARSAHEAEQLLGRIARVLDDAHRRDDDDVVLEIMQIMGRNDG